MKLLVLSQAYPSDNNNAMMFVHTRNIEYISQGHSIDVISFSTQTAYSFQNVNIYPLSELNSLIGKHRYTAAIMHAPNIRNHIRVLRKILKYVPKIFIIFHGHEILKKSCYYPQPYHFKKPKLYLAFKIIDACYDYIKCRIIQKISEKHLGKEILYIFVSSYLKQLFKENIKIDSKLLDTYSIVAPNAINPAFTNNVYDSKSLKRFDFITIRNFDQSVYATNIVVQLAFNYPNLTFHLYGQGNYFNYHQKPLNLTVFNQIFNPGEIPNILNQYRAALMPSYHDSQGVMACEMATFGIPLIVSDIPATREFFSNLPGIYFINNSNPYININEIFKACPDNQAELIRRRLSLDNTVLKEIRFISHQS